MKLQLALELLARLRIGFLSPGFEEGVAEKAVGIGVVWIKLNGLAKLGSGGFRKMADGIGATDENVQSGGITHGAVQALEPLLGVREALCLQIGNTKKIGSFKVVIEGDRGLKIANGGFEITAVEVNAAEDVLGTGVTRIIGDNGLGKLAGFLDVAGAEPSYGSIDSDIRIGRGGFERFVELASGFVGGGVGKRKIRELAGARGGGTVGVAGG